MSSQNSRCRERILSQDAFGPSLAFNYPDGETNHRSTLGACISLLVTLTTWIFLIQNLVVLHERSDTSFVSSLRPHVHDENYTYTEEEGLQFAVGYMVKVNPEANVSPSDLFNIEMWGGSEEYSLHNCTADEMKELQDGSGKFFPLEPAMKQFVKQEEYEN